MGRVGSAWSALCKWCSNVFHGKPALGRDYADVLAQAYFSKIELAKMRLGREPSELESAQAFKAACEEVVEVLTAKLANYDPEQVAATADVRPVSPPPPPPIEKVVVTEESSPQEGGEQKGD